MFMGIKLSLILWFNPSAEEKLLEVKHNILCNKHNDISVSCKISKLPKIIYCIHIFVNSNEN